MLKKKQKNKKRKLYHFINLFNDNIYYYDFKTIIYKGFKGTAFCIEKSRKQTDQEFKTILNKIIKKYDNTSILKTFCEYAPEIKKTWLFLAYKEEGCR